MDIGKRWLIGYLDNDWYLTAINQLLTQRCGEKAFGARANLLFYTASVYTAKAVLPSYFIRFS